MMESTVDRPPPRNRLRSRRSGGTRGVLALATLGLAWLAREHREAGRRAGLVAELGRGEVLSRLAEATVVGQVVKKFWPGREGWLRARMGGGWFDHPSIFVAFGLDDARVPEVAQRLRELGTIREVHHDGVGLTGAGIAALRADLPGVNVLPNASPAEHHKFLAAMQGTHLAAGALGFPIAVAVLALGSPAGRCAGWLAASGRPGVSWPGGEPSHADCGRGRRIRSAGAVGAGRLGRREWDRDGAGEGAIRCDDGTSWGRWRPGR